jgi:hypothetical protein
MVKYWTTCDGYTAQPRYSTKTIRTHPIISAVMQKDVPAVRRILEKDPRAVFACSASSVTLFWTPAHFAAKNDDVDMLKALVHVQSTALSHKSRDGSTVAHIAASEGNFCTLDFISMSCDAAVLIEQDNNGSTPAHAVAQGEAIFLQTRKETKESGGASLRGTGTWTTLSAESAAATANNSQGASTVQNQPGREHTVQDRSARGDIVQGESATYGTETRCYEYAKCMRLLLESDSESCVVTNDDGQTPMCFCTHASTMVAKELMHAGQLCGYVYAYACVFNVCMHVYTCTYACIYMHNHTCTSLPGDCFCRLDAHAYKSTYTHVCFQHGQDWKNALTRALCHTTPDSAVLLYYRKHLLALVKHLLTIASTSWLSQAPLDYRKHLLAIASTS